MVLELAVDGGLAQFEAVIAAELAGTGLHLDDRWPRARAIEADPAKLARRRSLAEVVVQPMGHGVLVREQRALALVARKDHELDELHSRDAEPLGELQE